MTELVMKDFTDETSSLMSLANVCNIETQVDYDESEQFLKTTKSLKKVITDFFEPMRKAADEAKKAILTRKNDALNPVEEADTIVRRKRQVFRDEQEKIRREKQRLAEEKADREAEAERKRLAKRSDNAKKPETKERLQEQAGEVYVKPVFVESVIETGSVRKDTKIQVVNAMAFINEVSKGNIPPTCIEIKEGKVKAWVKACGKTGNEVPGIIITQTTIDSVRG